MAVPAHPLQAVQVGLKSVSNEGHYILVAEKVFRPYPDTHCTGVTDIYHVTIPAHATRAVQVRLKPVSNEGRFTLQAETHFPPYLPSHYSGVNEI
jgi:hypothetical protein